MTINIEGVQKLSLVNGDGCRLVIFVQGCAHHCKGCQNPQTWPFNGGEVWNTVELAAAIRPWVESHPIDGITLSGGDPMYQDGACMELLELLPDDLNVWLYTGFVYEEIKDRPLVRRADVVVDGEYVEALRCEGQMYGSSNQRIIRKGRSK